jgi:hypothetical protein
MPGTRLELVTRGFSEIKSILKFLVKLFKKSLHTLHTLHNPYLVRVSNMKSLYITFHTLHKINTKNHFIVVITQIDLIFVIRK